MTEAVKVRFEPKMMIDGKLVDGQAGTFTNINPATEESIGEVADASKEDMRRAIDAARRAFDETDWSTNHKLRQRCLLQLHEAIESEIDELREELILEVGSPRAITFGPQLDAPLEDGLKYPARLIDTYPWETDLGDKVISLTGTLTLTSPSSLAWSATLNGSNQGAVDTVATNQQFSVSDQSGSGAGWHITVSGTTFTSSGHTLPNSGTFVLTGSVTSVTATTAPTATCVTSCTPPTDTTTYPVAITTATSSPTPATVYDVSAGSGIGPVTLGGSSAANPVGWWTDIPANARSGSYTSTVTVEVVSGP